MISTVVLAIIVIIGVTIWYSFNKKISVSHKKVPEPAGWPLFGNCIEIMRAEDTYALLNQWAERYGSIFAFRIGTKQTIVINDYELIKEALHHPGMQGRHQEIITADRVFGPGTGITDGVGKALKEQRAFALNVFRSFGVGKSAFNNIISEEASRIIAALLHCKGPSEELTEIFAKASCNIISGISFGKQRNYNDPELVKHQQSIRRYFKIAGPGIMYILSSLPILLYFGIGKEVLGIRKMFFALFDNEIAEHKSTHDGGAHLEENSDFIDAYLRKIRTISEESDRQFFNEGNLMRILSDFYLAGTETVASTMTWTVLLLAMHGDVQQRCQEELDAVIGRNREVKLGDRSNLPYILATIEEVSRIGCVVPLGIIHKTEADVELEGYHIPKGSYFGYNNYSLCRNPSYWNDPFTFKPDRHLDEHGKFVKPIHMLPFGSGKRSCIGEELARMEVFIWTTTILQKLNLKFPPNYTPPNPKKGSSGLTRVPLPFHIEVEELNPK